MWSACGLWNQFFVKCWKMTHHYLISPFSVNRVCQLYKNSQPIQRHGKSTRFGTGHQLSLPIAQWEDEPLLSFSLRAEGGSPEMKEFQTHLTCVRPSVCGRDVCCSWRSDAWCSARMHSTGACFESFGDPAQQVLLPTWWIGRLGAVG